MEIFSILSLFQRYVLCTNLFETIYSKQRVRKEKIRIIVTKATVTLVTFAL